MTMPNDLMQTLLVGYRDDKKNLTAAIDARRENVAEEAVQAFVEWCRQRLADNQPVAMEYVESGFAIRFQDHTVVPFTTAGQAEQTGGDPGAVPIGKQHPSGPGGPGGIDRQRSRSFPVTGKLP